LRDCPATARASASVSSIISRSGPEQREIAVGGLDLIIEHVYCAARSMYVDKAHKDRLIFLHASGLV
jgi:hypothetical protein